MTLMETIKTWLKNLFTRRKEFLVHTMTFELNISYTNDQHEIESKEDDVRFRIHFFETNKGERRYELFCSSSRCNAEGVLRKRPIYHDVVYPWLHGRYVSEVPKWSDVEMLDLQKRLSE